MLLGAAKHDFDKADINVNLALCYFNKQCWDEAAEGGGGSNRGGGGRKGASDNDTEEEKELEGHDLKACARSHAFDALNLVPNHPQAMIAIADVQLDSGEVSEGEPRERSEASENRASEAKRARKKRAPKPGSFFLRATRHFD